MRPSSFCAFPLHSTLLRTLPPCISFFPCPYYVLRPRTLDSTFLASPPSTPSCSSSASSLSFFLRHYKWLTHRQTSYDPTVVAYRPPSTAASGSRASNLSPHTPPPRSRSPPPLRIPRPPRTRRFPITARTAAPPAGRQQSRTPIFGCIGKGSSRQVGGARYRHRRCKTSGSPAAIVLGASWAVHRWREPGPGCNWAWAPARRRRMTARARGNSGCPGPSGTRSGGRRKAEHEHGERESFHRNVDCGGAGEGCGAGEETGVRACPCRTCRTRSPPSFRRSGRGRARVPRPRPAPAPDVARGLHCHH
ncbi:hypothetical protein FB451DRAFT_66585 [Mycena latifolia]|nr:hypothetical protein FB451DRAFT_66585 [Mycena latifolia]